MEELLKQILAEMVKLNATIEKATAVFSAGARPSGPVGMPPNMAEMMKRRMAARGARLGGSVPNRPAVAAATAKDTGTEKP